MTGASPDDRDLEPPLPARLPFAGLLALLVVLVADRVVFSAPALWTALDARMAQGDSLEAGLVRDRVELDRLERLPRPHTLLVGSSRARRGLRPELLAAGERAPGGMARLAHAGLQPLELRSMADALAARRPDALVLMASEFTTHRPLALVPQATSGSLGALADLAALTGWRFVLEHRTSFLRMAMVGLLESYRYRDVLSVAGAARLHRFPLDERFPEAPAAPRPDALAGEAPLRLDAATLAAATDALVASLPDVAPGVVRSEIQQLRSVTRGPHARVRLALLERALARLRAAGVDVLVVEGPVHPRATLFYDATIRDEFVAAMERLAGDGLCRLLPLEALPPFGEEHFRDLTHLTNEGGARFTRPVMSALGEMIAARARAYDARATPRR